MFISHGFPSLTHWFRSPCAPLLLSALLLQSGTALAAEDEDTQLPFGQTERSDPDPVPSQPMSHADRPASSELLQLARREPMQFIGKIAVLETGRHIGSVRNIQRSLDDGELYLILDATAFFNNPTDYAVPARDMKRLDDDSVVIAEFTGMHLRGLEYYEADYEDIDGGLPAGVRQATD